MNLHSGTHGIDGAPPRARLVRGLRAGLLAAFLAAHFLFPAPVEGQFNRTSDPDRWIEQARSLERLRQYERALVLYERVLQSAPDNRSALNGAVRLYFRLEAFDRAVRMLETHIETSPDDIRMRGRLASALFSIGRDDDAEAHIRILEDRFPRSESAVSAIANLHIDRQAYDLAIQAYLAGRERLEKPEAFALALASVYTSAYDVPGAVREFVRWLTQQPTQHRIVNDRIDLLAGLGGQELVERSLRSAVSEHRGSKDAHNLLGGFFLRSGKPMEALAAYREADRLDGSSGNYLVRFAEWALREGHHEDAIDAYRELTRTAASDTLRARASDGLARAFLESGRVDDAAETYRETIARYPETGFRDEAMAGLADIHLVQYRDAPRALVLYRSLLDSLDGSEGQGGSEGRDGPGDLGVPSGPFGLESLDSLDGASGPSYRERAMFGIAESYVAMGSLDDALVQLNRIRDPASGFAGPETRARTSYLLGELALFQGRLDDALEHFHETADRHAGSPYANDALEWTILIAEGRQGGDQPFSDYVRSVLLRRRHMDMEALAACKSFVEEHPQSLIADTVILDIGLLLDRLGKPFQAVAALRDLIERHPESRRVAAARWRIAEIYETKIGDVPQALAEYETLLLSHPDHFRNDAARRKIRELTENHPPMP